MNIGGWLVGNIRKSQERTEKMNKTLVFAIVAGILLFLTGTAMAGSHSWYFSQSGNDSAGDGSIGNPWKTLSKAQTKINNANVDDTVNLYFYGGDEWTVNSGAAVTTIIFGLAVDSGDPIVNIASYGSGKAIFNGSVTNFSSAAEHNQTTGPLRWNSFFWFNRDNCSVTNIEIKNMYGRAITVKAADNFTLSNCKISNFGADAIYIEDGASGSLIENNEIYQGQQLWRYSLRPSGWGAAISIQDYSNAFSNNIVRYNLVYDIYGEGIIIHGGTVEYNVVGDTYSVAIYYNGKYINGDNFIVRYNFVISSNSSDCRVLDGRTAYNGIGHVEERNGGSNNTGASVEIYGNIVINRYYGIYAKNTYTEPTGSFKIYNNTVIDCDLANYNISNPGNVTNAGYIYNNSSMLYDRTESDHDGANMSLPHINWDVDTNHFWTTGGSPTVDDGWTTNYVTTDPKLPGEPSIDWDGQSGPTYYKDIDFDVHLHPPSDSGLVGNGKSLDDDFDNKLLTKGTKWSDSPGITAQLAEQNAGDWDVGASKYSGIPNADINNDSKVNIEDFAIMVAWWDDGNACSSPGWCEGADFDMSGTVDMFDLTYFAENWLRQ